MTRYVGRFAPSPTGLLHIGSVVAALASWLDARAHHGKWLVRMEDIDTPRCVAGTDQVILQQLAALRLLPDEPPIWQSQRTIHYHDALQQLKELELVYPCACSRKDIELAQAQRGIYRQRGKELPYPGTCRQENGGLRGRTARAWRMRSDSVRRFALNGRPEIVWQDRRLGTQAQNVEHTVGDFVLRRADGLWAYQLAVVVDDALQGITHVVRGEDLVDNTARQILLQRALRSTTPTYLHTPLVLDAHGQKLSKQSGAVAIDLDNPLKTLSAAAKMLKLPTADKFNANSVEQALATWVRFWVEQYAAITT